MKSTYILFHMIYLIILGSKIYPQFTWIKTNFPDNINVNNFTVGTNGELYAATSDGLYTTTNKGNNWIKNDFIFDDNELKAITSKEPGTIFVAPKNNNSYNIYRTDDNGSHWTTLSNFYFHDNVNSILYGINGNIFAGVHYNYLATLYNSILRSTDDGLNWQLVKGVNSNCDEALLVRNANGDIFATGVDLMLGSNISHSTDDGNTWSELNIGENYSCITSININKNNHIFVGIWEDIIRSTDNGNTWTKLHANFVGTNINTISFDRYNNIYAGTSKGIFISSNNGGNWILSNTGLTNIQVTAIIENEDGTIYAGTQGGGVFRLKGGENDFWEQTNGPNSGVIEAMAANTLGDIFAVSMNTTNGGVFKSTNNGDSWEVLSNGIEGAGISAINIDNTNNILIGTEYYNGGGIYYSIDNGVSWENRSNGLPNFVKVNTILRKSPNEIFIGVDYYSHIYRTTNNGENWFGTGYFSASSVMTIVKNAKNYIFAGTNVGIYRSSNNGNDWNYVSTGFANDFIRALTIGRDDFIYAATNDGIYRSTNDGEIWYKVTNGYYFFTTIFKSLNGDLYAGMDGEGQYNGVIKSTNNGDNWSNLNDGLLDKKVNCFAEKTYIFAGTHSGIVHKSKQPSIVSQTPVILIPGVMGSPLYDDADNDSHLRAWERAWLGPQLPNLLLQNNGNDPINPNAKIKSAPLHNDNYATIGEELTKLPLSVYNGFFITLQQNGYVLDNYDDNHTQGENLFCFTYDWRKNNTGNAQLLSWFIDSVKKWTGAPKVNLVTHSMGGLISKKCISIFDKTRVNNIIFIGTPHLGAPETITVLYTGVLGRWYDFVTRGFVEKLARNLPSCYQLAPSVKYFDTGLNNNISIDVDKYLLCFQLANGSYANYIEMNEYINSTLNTVLNDNAETFRESISYVDFGNINVFNIVGYNFATIGQNRVIPNFNPPLYRPARILNGDKTVPLRSAEIINDATVQHTYYIPDVEHHNLPSSSEGLEVILGVLKNPSITNFPQYANPPQSYSAPNHIQVEVACPVAIHAYDTLGRHTGPLTDSTWETNIPGSIYIPGALSDTTSTKTILLAQGSTYRLRIQSLNAYGNFNFFLQEVTDGSVNKILIYDSIPFQTNTSVACNLNVGYSLPQLEIDLNNDGTIDTLISPKDFTTEIKDMNLMSPQTFELEQNYPNPFNPSTTIKFSLAENSHVSLKIYDILGKEAMSLIDETLKKGNYTYSINASQLASGIYIYRLIAGSFVDTKKMLLLK